MARGTFSYSAILFVHVLGCHGLLSPESHVSYEMMNVGVGIELSVAIAGTGTTPMVMFHGFPECSWFWRGTIDTLLEDPSLKLFMPDMRGFNRSSAPQGIASYNISFLVADAVGLIKLVGGGNPVHVVGHDWGGMMVAWFVAGQYPEFVRTLTILNAPHPSVFDDLIRHDKIEQKTSSYQFYFDTVAANMMDTASFFTGSSWFDEETRDAYKAAYRASGGPEPGLNWYRANIFGGRMNVRAFTKDMPTNFPSAMIISAPTLVLWGMKDTAFDNEACLAGLHKFVPHLTIKTEGYENVSHWIAQEEPVKVARDILSFLRHRNSIIHV